MPYTLLKIIRYITQSPNYQAIIQRDSQDSDILLRAQTEV